jgi:hypothetical protein
MAEASYSETEQDDVSMSVAVTIDFLPTVIVIREHNPTFRERFLYDGLIYHPPRFVMHGENLMVLCPQPGGNG